MAESAKVARVKLCLDGDLLDEHAMLEIRLAGLTEAGETGDDAVAVAKEIVALEQRIADAETEYTFRGLGRGRWRKLKADHPPTDEHKSFGAEFDVDEFPFVAMAACIESPKMTADDFRKLNDEVLDEVQFNQLWATCLAANLGGGSNRPESGAARSLLESVRRRSEQPSDSGSAAAS